MYAYIDTKDHARIAVTDVVDVRNPDPLNLTLKIQAVGTVTELNLTPREADQLIRLIRMAANL